MRLANIRLQISCAKKSAMCFAAVASLHMDYSRRGTGAMDGPAQGEVIRLKPPHVIDYRIYFDEERNLCLKGRAFYFFYVLMIMLVLCIGLPFAVYCDKTIVITGTVFFLLFVLFVVGLSTSVRIIFFKPIQRSITIARSGTIYVRDAMIIGRRSFELKLDEITDIAFVYYRVTGIFQDYRVLVRFKDGKDRFLVDEDVLLLERQARKARQELCTMLKELHRDSAISVRECSRDMY